MSLSLSVAAPLAVRLRPGWRSAAPMRESRGSRRARNAPGGPQTVPFGMALHVPRKSARNDAYSTRDGSARAEHNGRGADALHETGGALPVADLQTR